MRNKLILGFVLVFLLMISSVFASPSDYLVAHWGFDESSGTNAEESLTGNNITLSTTGMWVSGVIGNAVNSTSTSATGTSASALGISGSSARTLSVWIKGADLGNDKFIGGWGSDVSGGRFWFGSGTTTTRDLKFYRYFSDFDLSYQYEQNTFNHLFLTYDGTYLATYKNNVLVQNTSTSLTTTDSVFYLFREISNNPTYNAGGITLDELSIFDAVLSDADRTIVYESELAGIPYPWIGYFQITAQDAFNLTSILTFNATINNTLYQTTNGTIVTDYNSSETGLLDIVVSADNYFNTSYLDYNASFYLFASLTQAYANFTTSAIITNETIIADNYTISGTTKNAGELFSLNAGTHEVLMQKAGWYNLTQNITVSALTNQTYNLTGAYDAQVTINFYNAITNASISDVSFNISNSTYSYLNALNISTGYNLSLLTSLNYTVAIEKASYNDIASNITDVTDGAAYNFYLFKNNELFLNFIDEQTLLPVLNVNATVSGTTIGYEFTTTTGQINVTSLPDGIYSIEYDADNYTVRNYFANIPEEDSSLNITLYLLKDSTATQFVLSVTNKRNDPVTGLYASLLRRYVINNQTQYRVVEMMQPSFALQGSTRFSGEANFVPYLFRVENSQGEILFQGAGRGANDVETLFLIDPEIFIRVQTSASPFQVSEGIDNFQYAITNASNTFWASFDDTAGVTDNVCLQVVANGSTIVGTQCTTDGSGILSQTYTPNNQTTFTATLIGTDAVSNLNRTIGAYSIDREDPEQFELFGIVGLFLLFITLIVFSIGLATNLPALILMNVLAIVVFGTQFIGLVYVSVTMQGTLLLVGLIIMFVLRGNN